MQIREEKQEKEKKDEHKRKRAERKDEERGRREEEGGGKGYELTVLVEGVHIDGVDLHIRHSVPMEER